MSSRWGYQGFVPQPYQEMGFNGFKDLFALPQLCNIYIYIFTSHVIASSVDSRAKGWWLRFHMIFSKRFFFGIPEWLVAMVWRGSYAKMAVCQMIVFIVYPHEHIALYTYRFCGAAPFFTYINLKVWLPECWLSGEEKGNGIDRSDMSFHRIATATKSNSRSGTSGKNS